MARKNVQYIPNFIIPQAVCSIESVTSLRINENIDLDWEVMCISM